MAKMLIEEKRMLIKKNANRNWKEKVPSFPAFETPHNKKPAVKKKIIAWLLKVGN